MRDLHLVGGVDGGDHHLRGVAYVTTGDATEVSREEGQNTYTLDYPTTHTSQASTMVMLGNSETSHPGCRVS